MKSRIVIIISFLLIACSNAFKEEGSITVKNGEGAEVSVPYEILGYDDFKKQFSKDNFEYFVEKASDEAKGLCKYERTYVPIEITLMIKSDTVTVHFNFSAKNAFGVPDEIKSYTQFKGLMLLETLSDAMFD